MRRRVKFIILIVPLLVIAGIGIACGCASDFFGWLSNRLRAVFEEIWNGRAS